MKKKDYRWGLFSDYGQKILNLTRDTKREVQQEFHAWGYTKDSEVWIEKVSPDARGRFDP